MTNATNTRTKRSQLDQLATPLGFQIGSLRIGDAEPTWQIIHCGNTIFEGTKREAHVFLNGAYYRTSKFKETIE